MTVQLSTRVRNARINAIPATIGASAVLKFRTGAPPASCAAADSGTVLATLNLPSTWLAAASSGAAAKSGTWEDLSADATGTVGHVRIYDSGGASCDFQGTVTSTGGGGDMTVDSTSFTATADITVTAFSMTDANG